MNKLLSSVSSSYPLFLYCITRTYIFIRSARRLSIVKRPATVDVSSHSEQNTRRRFTKSGTACSNVLAYLARGVSTTAFSIAENVWDRSRIDLQQFYAHNFIRNIPLDVHKYVSRYLCVYIYIYIYSCSLIDIQVKKNIKERICQPVTTERFHSSNLTVWNFISTTSEKEKNFPAYLISRCWKCYRLHRNDRDQEGFSVYF